MNLKQVAEVCLFPFMRMFFRAFIFLLTDHSMKDGWCTGTLTLKHLIRLFLNKKQFMLSTVPFLMQEINYGKKLNFFGKSIILSNDSGN